MGAIKIHHTKVDKTGTWDGPKAVADAPNDEQVLTYMHAWKSNDGDPTQKGSYKDPHHLPGTDTAAVIRACNNGLARMAGTNIPDGDKPGTEAHLRAHRKDAGLEESMSEAEIAEAVKYIKDVDDLKAAESQALAEAVRLQETRVDEAATIKAKAKSAARALRDLLADKTLPKDLHDSVESLVTALQKTWADLATDATPPATEAGHSNAVPLQDEYMPLIEKAVRADGIVPIKIIQPGWGSSGFYPAEVLRRDGPKIFTAGTKMYWNHQTPAEEAERPEGDLNNLAAVLTSDARWLDQGPKGAGLYADAKVFEKYQQPVDGLAPHIGVSIRAYGKASQGSMERKTGPVISELTARRSVDFVTEPGAGGEIITMFEAARTVRDARTQSTTSQKSVENNVEADMTEQEVKELKDANTTLKQESDVMKAENARLQEALLLREAQDVDGAVLAKSNLPEVTKKRLAESLAKAAPAKDGKLDKAAFETQIAEAVKAEVKYLTEVAGLGKIKGLGESGADGEEDQDEQGDKIQESLEASFLEIGLDEKAAKAAAKGRG